MKYTPLLAAVLYLFSLASGLSAVLTGSLNTTPPPSVNLTTTGTFDWAIWNTNSTTGLSSRAPTNRKAGSPNAISAITPVGGGNVQGVTVGSSELYSYTNGNSPATLTNSTQYFVINNGLDTIGRGVQFTITGDPTKTYQIDVWTSGLNATGTLTATTAGAPTFTDSNSYGSTKTPALYSFTFQPNQVSDLLTIQYVLTTDSGSSAHVGIQAVSISVVPEPTTLALAAGAVISLASFRRTRRST